MNAFSEIESKIIAILISSNQPVSSSTVRKIVEISNHELKAIIENLNKKLNELNLPFQIREIENKYEVFLSTSISGEISEILNRYNAPPRMSRAALETLAVICMKEPVTRAEIAKVRGVAPDSSLNTLLEYGLIDRISEEGKIFYVITDNLLRALGIKSKKELQKILSECQTD